jgi:LacI family transcriptional regulator
MNQGRRVTMKDVSEAVGCNKSTVSLALRNRPEVAEETRKRVQAAAERLGYVPDPVLSAVAASRWDPTRHHRRDTGATVAFVYSRPPDEGTPARYCEAARVAAEARGYRLEVFYESEYPNVSRLESILVARGIRGMIYNPATSGDFGRKLAYEFPRLTVVACAYGWTRLPFHSVNFDWFAAVQTCWRELYARGYRRIGAALFAHHPPAEDDFARFGAAMANELLAPGTDPVPPLTTVHANDASFVAWVKEHRPDAIVGFHAGLYFQLRDPKNRLPQDIAFASLITSQHPEIAGTEFLVEKIGEAALELLVASLLLNERGLPKIPRSVMIEPSFVAGPSAPTKRQI